MKTLEVNEEMLLEANKSHLVLVELPVRNGQGTCVSELIMLVSCVNITTLLDCWSTSGLLSIPALQDILPCYIYFFELILR